MSETPAQELERLRAEDAARRADAEKKKKEEAEQQQLTMLGRIWDAVTDNLWLFALAFVAYVMIGPKKLGELWDKGSEFVGGLLDKVLPESWKNNLNALTGRDVSAALEGMEITEIRKTLLDKKMPAEVVNVLAKDKETFVGFLNVARDANDPVGRKVKASEFTNDKTVFELLKQKPEMVRKLAEVALKADGATANSPAVKEIKVSLLAIVKDNRLDVLMNPPHLDNTRALFAMMPGVSKQEVDAMTADGKNVPALRTILVAALSPAASPEEQKAKIAAAVQVSAPMMSADTLKTAIDAWMKPQASDDPETKALKTNNGGKALAALREKLGDQKLLAFGAIYKSGDEVAMMKFALENRPAFQAFHGAAIIKDLGPKTQTTLTEFAKQPEAATAPLLAIINNGVDPRHLQSVVFDEKGKQRPTAALVDTLVNNPAARVTLEKAGTDNLVALMKAYEGNKIPAAVTPKNLSAILTAAHTIGGHERMKDDTTRLETVRVLTQFVTMAQTENPDVLGKLTNKEVAEFMKVPTNSAALKTLLEQTKDSLPKAKADTVGALLANWEIVTRLTGNEEGAEFLKQAMSLSKITGSKEDIDSCKNTDALGAGTKAFIAFKSYGLTGKTFVGQHADEIEQLALALKAAECSSVPAPSSTPSRKVTTSSPMRSHVTLGQH